MNARIRRFSSENPVVPFTGEVNVCPSCGSLPRYTRSNCGGHHLGCECGSLRTESCTDNLTCENANKLREEWNGMVVDAVVSSRSMRKYGATNGSLAVIRSEDAALLKVFEEMDDALAYLKAQCKKDFLVDFDLTQFVQVADDKFTIAHISTSKVLAYVGSWQGFDESKLTVISE